MAFPACFNTTVGFARPPTLGLRPYSLLFAPHPTKGATKTCKGLDEES